MPSYTLVPLTNRELHQSRLMLDEHSRPQFYLITTRTPQVALPPEILSEIFIHCLSDDAFIRPDPTTAPLILCRICRQFKEIALTTPTLWSSLFMDLSRSEEVWGYELEAEYIGFCRRTPLSLYLTELEGTWPASLLPFYQDIAVLAPQWRNVRLDFTIDLAETLLSAENFPLLEELTITSDAGESYFDFPDVSTFRHAPKLRKVFIDTTLIRHIQLPWHRLTTFRNCCVNLLTIFAILRDASSLVDASFGTDDWDDPPLGLPVTILQRIHLQSLTLIGAETIAIINWLKTPALKSLEFLSYNSSASESSAFLSFVSRSSFLLHTLTLSVTSTTTEQLIECLQAVPSLAHLTLQSSSLVDWKAIFSQFAGHPDFLPKLESFHTPFATSRAFAMTGVTLSVLVEMLCWRWDTGGITRLQSFELTHHDDATIFVGSIKSDPQICRLELQGMHLHIGQRRHGVLL
ncbi:hypothetical protein C8R43DRAFT_1199574 [Mycena crocata]|nr:hypothetical protein C8R43DRAFT_1199574 [Mycena crocata]